MSVDAAGVPRRDHGAGATLVHLPAGHHHRGLGLGAHGLDGVVGAEDAICGVDDLHVRRHVIVLPESPADGGFVTDEQDADALAGGVERACHGNLRCFVATHRIDGNDDVGHGAQAPVSTTARPL